MAIARNRTYSRLLLPGLLAALLALTVGCDDGPPPLDEGANKDKKATKAANPAAKAALNKLKKKLSAKKAEAEVTVLVLAEKDFVESTTNRDPFRQFARLFNRSGASTVVIQRRVLLKRYSLDELRLMAIISGNTRPVAMFVDPKGKGVTIKRGDYISKSEGRVKQILHDKVIIEIEEKTESGSTTTDRVIPLHEKGSTEGEEPMLGAM